jgi:hypothetical protein
MIAEVDGGCGPAGAAGDRRAGRLEERFHLNRVMGEVLEVYREAIERAKERGN